MYNTYSNLYDKTLLIRLNDSDIMKIKCEKRLRNDIRFNYRF